MEFDVLSNKVIGLAIELHTCLGAGLFEQVYKVCLIKDLEDNGFKVDSEVEIPVIYKGSKLDIGYRADIIVDDSLILELKSVDIINPIHKAQLLTYLRLSNIGLGLLINFNATSLKNQIVRMVN